jgi:hypothetical protein
MGADRPTFISQLDRPIKSPTIEGAIDGAEVREHKIFMTLGWGGTDLRTAQHLLGDLLGDSVCWVAVG